jgi:hypothetical protein
MLSSGRGILSSSDLGAGLPPASYINKYQVHGPEPMRRGSLVKATSGSAPFIMKV